MAHNRVQVALSGARLTLHHAVTRGIEVTMKRFALCLGMVLSLSLAVLTPASAANITPGQKCPQNQKTALAKGKMYTCKAGKWDSGAPATIERKAYSKCALWKGNTSLGFRVAKVGDNGKTLVLERVGKFALIKKGLTYSQLVCTLKVLKAPGYVRSQIESTRAIDGMQRASWGLHTAFWTYHPDSGVNITFSSA